MELNVGVGLRELGTRPGEEQGGGQVGGRGCRGRGLGWGTPRGGTSVHEDRCRAERRARGRSRRGDLGGGA